MRTLLTICLLHLMLLLGGCQEKEAPPATSGETGSAEIVLKLATTTSTDHSGLLKELLPVFKDKTNITVHVIAVGTGKAIKHGENGDVDVILVHAPQAEKEFVSQGFGLERIPVMHNDFILLGPANDPAGIRGTRSGPAALRKIAESMEAFVSRGDDSGTHKKELSLWGQAEIKPAGAWYISTGQGMGPVLTIADEKEAYTIADRGTYLAYADKLDLQVLVEGGKPLFNPYSVIAVNPARHNHIKDKEAQAFIAYLTSAECRKQIENFRINGKQLFVPSTE